MIDPRVSKAAEAAWKQIEDSAKEAGAAGVSVKLAAFGILFALYENIRGVSDRIDALERQQKALRYRGVHQRAETYQKNNLVTYDGGLWIALKDDPGKPGEGDGWQLVAKGAR